MIRILSFAILFYQKVKHAFFPATCRFYPSCSDYSLLAFKKYGFLKGLSKSVRRIFRCSPLSQGGYDPLT
ncbi:MAG: membrane protein insertion efficiency factor YidD [Candidatus Omnitrophica bacterium]|nr:membrane protein insertion efficiency factor YidD [Candidatus Omnitrophota bacterium]